MTTTTMAPTNEAAAQQASHPIKPTPGRKGDWTWVGWKRPALKAKRVNEEVEDIKQLNNNVITKNSNNRVISALFKLNSSLSTDSVRGENDTELIAEGEPASTASACSSPSELEMCMRDEALNDEGQKLSEQKRWYGFGKEETELPQKNDRRAAERDRYAQRHSLPAFLDTSSHQHNGQTDKKKSNFLAILFPWLKKGKKKNQNQSQARKHEERGETQAPAEDRRQRDIRKEVERTELSSTFYRNSLPTYTTQGERVNTLSSTMSLSFSLSQNPRLYLREDEQELEDTEHRREHGDKKEKEDSQDSPIEKKWQKAAASLSSLFASVKKKHKEQKPQASSRSRRQMNRSRRRESRRRSSRSASSSRGSHSRIQDIRAESRKSAHSTSPSSWISLIVGKRGKGSKEHERPRSSSCLAEEEERPWRLGRRRARQSSNARWSLPSRVEPLRLVKEKIMDIVEPARPAQNRQTLPDPVLFIDIPEEGRRLSCPSAYYCLPATPVNRPTRSSSSSSCGSFTLSPSLSSSSQGPSSATLRLAPPSPFSASFSQGRLQERLKDSRDRRRRRRRRGKDKSHLLDRALCANCHKTFLTYRSPCEEYCSLDCQATSLLSYEERRNLYQRRKWVLD